MFIIIDNIIYYLCLQGCMAYVRKKKIKNNTYYYIVEGKVDSEQHVKQKVLRYLGSVENIIEKFRFWDEKH